jgi:DNA adenine methylase
MSMFKWAGSKRNMLFVLQQFLPVNITGRYIEPFAGSLALFFNLAIVSMNTGVPVLGTGAIISDINAPLMNFYYVVKNNAEVLIDRMQSYERFYGVDDDDTRRKIIYNGVREIFNSVETRLGDIEQAARFLFLVKTCHCGLYRVSKAGNFNSAFGYATSSKLINPDNIREYSRALALADMRCCDFESVLNEAETGDLVYLDPPYYGCFTAYSSNGFTESDQVHLRDACNELSARGVFFLLSNSDTPQTRTLYKDYNIHSVTVPRLIGRRHGAGGTASELIVTNYEVPIPMMIPIPSRSEYAPNAAEFVQGGFPWFLQSGDGPDRNRCIL